MTIAIVILVVIGVALLIVSIVKEGQGDAAVRRVQEGFAAQREADYEALRRDEEAQLAATARERQRQRQAKEERVAVTRQTGIRATSTEVRVGPGTTVDVILDPLSIANPLARPNLDHLLNEPAGFIVPEPACEPERPAPSYDSGSSYSSYDSGNSYDSGSCDSGGGDCGGCD